MKHVVSHGDHVTDRLRKRTTSTFIFHGAVRLIGLLGFEDERGNRPWHPRSCASSSGPPLQSITNRVSERRGIVSYCSSSGELTSARAAAALRKRGLQYVGARRTADGAWKKSDLPATADLGTESEATERLGYGSC